MKTVEQRLAYNAYMRGYYFRNKDKWNARRRVKLKKISAKSQWLKNNLDKTANDYRNIVRREWYYERGGKEWLKNNGKSKSEEYKQAKRIKRNARNRRRYREDIQYRLKVSLQNQLLKSFNRIGKSKPLSTIKLTGCSMAFLKVWLEVNFQPGMSWDNYGTHGWNIDHRRARRYYDLADQVQQRLCFHWTNLFPMWSSENCAKDNRIIQFHAEEVAKQVTMAKSPRANTTNGADSSAAAVSAAQ